MCPPHLCVWTTKEHGLADTCRLLTWPKERGPTRLARMFLTYALVAAVGGLFQGLSWVARYPFGLVERILGRVEWLTLEVFV